MNKRLLLLFITTGLFCVGISLVNGGVDAAEATQPGDFDIPPFAREMLEKEGITIDDLKNNPELHKEWLKKFQKMQGKKEEKRSGEHSHAAHPGMDLNPTPREGFYKIIVENSLFRPLGYTKPKPGPPFQLIATFVDRETDKSKALIRSNRDRKDYYVGVGEEFASAKVEKIESLKVTLLHEGESKEFHASKEGFLGGRGGDRGGHGDRGKGVHRGKPSPTEGRKSSPKFDRKGFNPEDMRRKLRDLPPNERRKVMRKMIEGRGKRRSEGGGRGDRGSKEKADGQTKYSSDNSEGRGKGGRER